jgi:hypothetical protein
MDENQGQIIQETIKLYERLLNLEYNNRGTGRTTALIDGIKNSNNDKLTVVVATDSEQYELTKFGYSGNIVRLDKIDRMRGFSECVLYEHGTIARILRFGLHCMYIIDNAKSDNKKFDNFSKLPWWKRIQIAFKPSMKF